ncbi:MAG TPA: 23S rRNA (adenine(2503)-C(2))-methyltransferase RlmN [Acholeplasmataceae bacterium]|jgi:23S rRNA (adenine2503-C2)-methyltransferase|nr:23S rRNA (adenine(2503)-C(2))-methyltransferase RlmN [Acholeplasmataceae bacterium]
MNIYQFTREKLQLKLQELGEKPYRATQIFEWVYKKSARNFFEMTNISKSSQELLNEHFVFPKLHLEKEQISKDGTRKYLFRLHDGNLIETVLMRFHYGNSVCISTQVGCNMGCAFCASGQHKRIRNLDVYEMVLQVYTINEILKKEDSRVSHVVIMGIGEPFDNYNNTIDFIKIINDDKGLGIGARHITLSTSGIVPKIIEFSHLPLQINLAISLHFPNDKLRSKYMPVNRKYNLEKLFDALKYYYEMTNRRITFEYILIDGINDTKECCIELINLLRGMNCYVNLIPMNETNTMFRRSSEKATDEFYDLLMQKGINVTLRRDQGHDIDAACGQLRIKTEMANARKNC